MSSEKMARGGMIQMVATESRRLVTVPKDNDPHYVPVNIECCDHAKRLDSEMASLRNDHDSIRKHVDIMRHQLYGNGDPGLFERVRTHEEILQQQKSDKREYRGWFMSILGAVIIAAVLVLLKLN
jgi:hypothetical protein